MIELTEKPIGVWEVLKSVQTELAGGIAHFIGTVRRENGISALDYECYPAMAIKLLHQTVKEARKQWSVERVSIVHRMGRIPVGDPSVVIAVSAAHRREAFASFRGKPLIERVAQTMKEIFHELLIVTNTPDEYRHLNIPVAQDLEAYQGPLGGIVTAFSHSRKGRLFVAACDMPLLDKGDILQILQEGNPFDAAIPIQKGNRHYLMASYARSLLPQMKRHLKEGRFSLEEFCRTIENIAWIPLEGRSAFNVNFADDLASLEKRGCLGGYA